MKNVSVIIPSREIDSVLKQNLINIRELYKDVPIILILDDIQNCSLIEVNNIRILKSESKNMSQKRNQGVDCSETEYVAFIDSDAYPCPNWLETGIAFLEENKDYSAVTGVQFNAKEDNLEQRCLRVLRFSPLFTRKEWQKINNIDAKDCDVTEFMTSNVIIRKCDFVSIGGFDKDIFLAEDNEISERFTSNGLKIRFKRLVMVYHRESTLVPFLRKLFCQGYYYSNVLVNKKYPASAKKFFKKNAMGNIFPLLLLVFYFVCLLFSLLYKKYLFALLIVPCFVLIIILCLSFLNAKKINAGYIKTSLLLFEFSMLYVVAYVLGLFWGILNIPIKDFQNLYKNF